MKRILILITLLLTISFSVTSLSAAVITKRSKSTTVKDANSDIYEKFISYSGELLSTSEVSEKIKAYGSYSGGRGMTLQEYKEAMGKKWRDLTLYNKKNIEVTIDLSKQYRYSELGKIMRNLSSHDGVYLYSIGKSVKNKEIYSLEVDMTKGKTKNTILLTGQVHARETAGPTFILKELIDLVYAYENGDQRAIDVLSTTRFVAVPCVNPDAHDGIGFHTKDWTYSDGQLWKANANGADLNRNFAGLSWMMTAKGFSRTDYISTSSKKIYYPGDSAGSEPETRAMMKFYQYWIGIRKAAMLVDYHQQGRISYTGKSYAPDSMNKKCTKLRKTVYEAQKGGLLGKSYSNPEETDEDTYKTFGRNGVGSTNTDYAWAVALGAKFSTQYGFSVYTDTEGNEHTILEVPNRGNTSLHLSPILVPTFTSFSWEIGYGKDYLGYSESTLKLIAKEYDNYNFGEMLYVYADTIKR